LVKKRPLTDPLIVHVSKLENVWPLVALTNKEKNLVELLGKSFWPGPLTLVLKKSTLLPEILTAGGDYIGIRIPNNKVALQLIEESASPVAAPSANLFGHV